MAALSTFKQSCPSCEALVPIRDPGLIGKKIDCPKCKYRFVVEEPAGDDEPEAATGGKKGSTGITTGKASKPMARRDDGDEEGDDDAGTKGKLSPKTLYLGIGLAALALVLLIGGGLLLFGGGGSSSNGPIKTNSGGGGIIAKGGPIAAPVAGPAAADPSAPAASIELGPVGDMANLLPNDTRKVWGFDLEKALNSSLKQVLLERPGAFSESAFQKCMGFSIDEVKRVLTAETADAQMFGVLRTGRPYNRDLLIKSLRLQAQTAIQGAEYFIVRGDLDSLSALLLRAGRPAEQKFGLHFLDANSFVVADLIPLRRFLEDRRAPKVLYTPPAEPAAPAATKGAPPPAGGKGGSTGSSQSFPETGVNIEPGQAVAPFQAGGPPGRGGPPAGAAPLGPPGGAPAVSVAAPDPTPSASPNYLTIDPALKNVLDRLERDKGLAACCFASLLQKGETPLAVLPDDLRNRDSIRTLLGPLTKPAQALKAFAIGLHELIETKMAGVVVLESGTDLGADPLHDGLEAGLLLTVPLFKSAWDMDVAVPGAKPAGSTVPGGAPGGFAGGPPGGFAGGPPPGTFPGGPPPGAPGGPAGGRPGLGGRRGGAGEEGGGASGRNGGGIGAPPAAGAIGSATETVGRDGKLIVSAHDRTVAAYAELALKRPLYDQIIALLNVAGVQVKGQADLVSSRSRVYELARALQAYVSAKGEFPRGALFRAPDSARGIDWYPEQRLSWLTELLPYLGEGEYKDLLRDDTKSWTEGDNLLTAQVIVPHFLSGGGGRFARVRYPGRSGLFAANHYAGVAGLGLDAANYPAGSAATSKQLGLFGYDRVVKADDIKDGPENTIAVLEMPAGQTTPWMAGGGSTVRGIPDGPDPLRTFVSVEYQGKRGTVAIMADYKVRFLQEGLKPETFRALCTIAGGETISGLDDLAPVIPEDKVDDLRNLAEALKPITAPPTSAVKRGDGPKIIIPDWLNFVSKTGRFQALYPRGEVKEWWNAQGGRAEKRTYTSSHEIAPKKFVQFGVEFHEGTVSNALQLEAFFQAARDGILADVKDGKIISWTNKPGLYPHTEFSIESPAATTLNRLIVRKHLLYHQFVSFPPEFAQKVDVHEFFDSFQFIGE